MLDIYTIVKLNNEALERWKNQQHDLMCYRCNDQGVLQEFAGYRIVCRNESCRHVTTFWGTIEEAIQEWKTKERNRRNK